MESMADDEIDEIEKPQLSRKSLPCRFCKKQFRRLEHVQRHERTHTKETPYNCPCGKAFSRRDLLRRHEKSAHNDDLDGLHPIAGPDDGVAAHAARSFQAYVESVGNYEDIRLLDVSQLPNTHIIGEQGPDGRAPSTLEQGRADCNLNLLSDAANQLASLSGHAAHPSTAHDILPSAEQNGLRNEHHQQLHMDESMPAQDSHMPTRDGGYNFFGSGPVDDYNLLLDEFDFSSYFLPHSLGSDFGVPFALSTLGEQFQNGLDAPNAPNPSQAGGLPSGRHEEQAGSFSRFGSPLPSLQHDRRARSTEHFPRSSPCWKVSGQDYRRIQAKFDDFLSVLPKDFVLPSRHTLSRYTEGCIKGLYEHLPFLHIPTFSLTTSAPELVLAMVAVGAQFRFEGHKGNVLFYAAEVVAHEQIRRRASVNAAQILSCPPVTRYGSHSASPTSHATADVSKMSGTSFEHGHEGGVRVENGRTVEEDEQGRLQTMQALLSLMVMGSWGPKPLIKEALSFPSLVAELVREDGLADADNVGTPMDSSAYDKPETTRWLTWARTESRKRTKLMLYCFVNLQCVAYNIPPAILTSEIACMLPLSAEEWKAEKAQQWEEVHRSTNIIEVPFQEAFASLFQGSGTPPTNAPMSSLGNYVLIFALLQRIYFTRQASAVTRLSTPHSLRPDDIDELSRALLTWQARWKGAPESNIEPLSPSGPVAFNSTALLRIAWIRLHSDLGPCRNLISRDPVLIAAAFKDSPPVERSARLDQAVLQAAHALSIPVRMGINFVARTQTVTWSIQQSLCNLECAILLSKWLEEIATTAAAQPLTAEEQSLISMIRSMLHETGFSADEAMSGATDVEIQQRGIRRIGTAVVRLWAEIFKGTHVFDVVNTIGASLNVYAELLERNDGSPNG